MICKNLSRVSYKNFLKNWQKMIVGSENADEIKFSCFSYYIFLLQHFEGTSLERCHKLIRFCIKMGLYFRIFSLITFQLLWFEKCVSLYIESNHQLRNNFFDLRPSIYTISYVDYITNFLSAFFLLSLT